MDSDDDFLPDLGPTSRSNSSTGSSTGRILLSSGQLTKKLSESDCTTDRISTVFRVSIRELPFDLISEGGGGMVLLESLPIFFFLNTHVLPIFFCAYHVLPIFFS